MLPGARKGVPLTALAPETAVEGPKGHRQYKYVRFEWDDDSRLAQLTVTGPSAEDVAIVERGVEAIYEAGAELWALRAYRELDDALLQLRVNHLDIGLVLVRAKGDPKHILAHDAALAPTQNQHWFANEVILNMARTLRRFDLTSRSFFALGDEGTAFVGNLAELALGSDRFYVLDDPDHPVQIGLSVLNEGLLPMSHGITRVAAHFIEDAEYIAALRGKHGLMSPAEADEAGLVTVLLDDVDWEDDTRVAIEERLSLSPDALTGMEANLRFPGSENADSKIFARLTAWQNWIFIRPNATGPEGALTLYGKPERPHFDWKRV
jgi:benzoyl-CoA-dihydrodiol lyase